MAWRARGRQAAGIQRASAARENPPITIIMAIITAAAEPPMALPI
jgi:hypothetical protein